MKLSHAARGFTLAELATVLLIIGLVVAGGLYVLPAQVMAARERETRSQLDEAVEGLISFALVNGRLPCPAAAPPAGGTEAPAGGGTCTNSYNGYLPARTLGLNGLNPQGYLSDAWGNPVRYAVTPLAGSTANALTSNTGGSFNGISLSQLSAAITNSVASNGPVYPGLIVCSGNPNKANNIRGCTPTTQTLTQQAVAVIWSMGPNGAGGTGGADETENNNGDAFFISHEWRDTGATGGRYQQIVTWLPYTTLVGRMVQAGRLP